MSVLKRALLLAMMLAFLVGCSSPEEKAQQFYEKGMEFLAAGNLNKANLEFRNALQINKKMPGAWYGLAVIAKEQDKIEDYFGLLKKVVDVKPNHFESLLGLGKIYLLSNQLDQAMSTSSRLMELQPDNAEVQALHANLLLKLEDYTGAVKHAQQALDIDKQSFHALYVLARERLLQKDFKGAEKFINEGLSINNDEMSLLILKATLEQQQNNTEKLIATMKQLVVLRPGNREFVKTLLHVYMHENRNADAEQLLRQAVERDIDDKNALGDLISFIYTTKGLQVAETEIQKIIQSNPEKEEYSFFLVELYLKGDKADLAEDKLRLLSSTGQSADIRVQAKVRLIELLIQKNEKKETIFELVNEVLAEDPQNTEALLVKAADIVDKNQYDQAISTLRSILRDNPGSAPALRMLGITHELSGDKDLAEDMYARAFEASKFAPEYAVLYANKLIGLKRQDTAVSVLEEALSASPNNLALLTRLAQLHIANNDWTKAQEVSERISQLNKGSEVSYQLQGIISAGQKDFDKSIESFKKAYESFPDSSRPLVSLIRIYVRAGQYEEAEKFLEDVLKTSPDNTNALLLKARLLSSQKKLDAAEQVYSDLIGKYPNNVSLYTELARLYLLDRQPDKALTVFDRGLESLPGNLELLMAKAGVLGSKRDYDAAILVYEEVVKVKPNAAVAINNLASLLSEHRDDPESLARAAELASPFKSANIPQFVDTLGWIYYKQGKYQEANELIARAAEKAPKDIGILFHLGMSNESLNDVDNARAQYEKILEIAGEREFSLRQQVEEALSRVGVESEIKAAVNQ